MKKAEGTMRDGKLWYGKAELSDKTVEMRAEYRDKNSDNMVMS